MKPEIKIKRVYEDPQKKDGFRILVDRVWPRGVKKENAAIDEWAKNLAPSTALRKWFGHDPELWTAFQKKYKAELKENAEAKKTAEAWKDKRLITLVFGAKDEAHTHALVLQQYLDNLFKKG